MICQPLKRPRLGVLLTALSIVTLIASYSYLSHRQHVKNPDDRTVPSWSQMWDGVVRSIQLDEFEDERPIVVDGLATTKRMFLGLFLGVAGAVLLGIHMGCFAWIEKLVLLPLSVFAKVPPTAALAIFFVVARLIFGSGTGLAFYVLMIGFGIMPTLAQSVYLAVKEVPKELIYKAYTIGASHGEAVWTIVFPHILPKVIDAIRLQIGPALVYLIAAEMLLASEGMGYRIRLEFKKLNMDIVYPYLAYLAAFAYALDAALKQVQRWTSGWYVTEGK
jgi:NitT/TauT family transport system permease protein